VFTVTKVSFLPLTWELVDEVGVDSVAGAGTTVSFLPIILELVDDVGVDSVTLFWVRLG